MKHSYCYRFVVGMWMCFVHVLCITAVPATQIDRLYTPDMIAWRGNTTYLQVCMDNTHDVTAVQFVIGIPRELKVETDAFRLTSRATDHVIQARRTKTDETHDWYLVMAFSPTNSLFEGRTGKIIDIKFTMSEKAKEGSQLRPIITDAVMSNVKKENVLRETSTGIITIEYGPDLIIPSVIINDMSVSPNGTLNLSWTVSNIGEESCEGGWKEEISIIDEEASSDNNTDFPVSYIGNVSFEGTLGGGSTVSRSASIILPSLLGIDGRCRVMVRIVPFPESNERPESRVNNTTMSQQTIDVEKRLMLNLSQQSVEEGNKATIRATLNRSGRWNFEETFHVSVTGDNRVSVPNSITLPVGQSAAMFDINIANNDKLDASNLVSTILVTDESNTSPYEAVSAQLTVEDDELPTLSLSATPSTMMEGDSIVFIVQAERAPSVDLPLILTCDLPKRFELPIGIVLPKGKTSVKIATFVKDDDVPATIVSPTFTVSASGYQSAQVYTLLYDNDVPAISLTLSPMNLSESAGPIAMIAVLRRTSNIDKEITVKLSDNSSSHDINYGQYSSISMPKGMEEVSFSLGINDNLEVDGDRDVTINAAVYIQSCSCSASGEDAGLVSQTIHIIDNDGPSLTITSSRSMLYEGAEEATVLTISRNTSVEEPLLVTIKSNYDDRLEYKQNVVIPAGEKQIKVPVRALANLTENDSKTVTFTATADGHSDGTCWAMVTDKTMPDAIISSMELFTENGETIGVDGVMVNDKVQARFTVENIGIVDLPAGTIVTVYQNSHRITTMTTSEPIAPGQRRTMTYNLYVPNSIGTFSAFAKVNEDETVHELLYVNNTSPIATINVRASFVASVKVDKNVLHYGDSVNISGKVTRLNNSTWNTDTTTEVSLYFIIDGQRYIQSVLANADGEFSYVWSPSHWCMGHVGIGACYPGEKLSDEMAYVDIYGLRRVSSSIASFYTVIDQPYSGKITIKNPGRLPLTNFMVSVIDNPDQATITFDAPNRIAGDETVDIGFTLTGHKIGGNNDWQTIKLKMSAAEGSELNHTIYYYTRNYEAQLSCNIQQINTTITKGSTRDYSFDVANIGTGNTGTVTLVLPQWMQSVTPLRMASMGQGDTTQVVIRFAPTDDMQLNVPVTGQIAINCENGNGLVIPYRIEPVSENTGNLVVDVCDEYTYYTEEAPHVSGATVTIMHPVTGSVIASDTTDISGCFGITLSEGYYTLLVTHPKHNSYRTNILLNPGKVTYKVVNLSYDAIEVSWDVVETTVEDVYDIVTTVQYETQVPVPVVTVSMPQNIEAHKLDDGESLVFYAVMTNVGLIAAKDVLLSMPEGFTELLFEPLDMAEPFELAPQQSVVMPIKVTRLPISVNHISPHRAKPLSEDDCYAKFPLAYFYECGTDRKFHKYYNGLRVAECEGKVIPVKTGVETGTYDGWGGGGGNDGSGGMGRPNSPQPIFGTSVTNQDNVESTGEPYQCNPCSNSALLALAKLFPIVGPILNGADIAKDIYNCGFAFTMDDGLHDKLANCKYTAGAVHTFDKYVDTVKDLYNDVNDIADYTEDIIGHIRDGEFFTKDCLDDWKGIYDSFYEFSEDAISLETQTQAVVSGFGNVLDKTTAEIDSWKETKQIVTDGMNRWVWNSDDVITNHQNDNYYNGTTSVSPKKKEKDRLEALSNIHEYCDAELATEDNYRDFVKNGINLISNGSLSREDRRKMAQDGVRILSDKLYNLHNFGEMSKSMNVNQQNMLKMAYIDNTNKLVEKAGDVADVLHYTFGECEYEGTEGGSTSGEGDIQPGGGGSISNISKKQYDNDYHQTSGITPKRPIHYSDRSLPPEYMELIDKALAAVDMVKKSGNLELEYFGDPEWLNLSYIQVAPVAWAIEQVNKKGSKVIENPNLAVYCPDGISIEMMKRFLRRWYNTFHIPNNPSGSVLPEPDGTIQRMNLQYMENLRREILEKANTILSGGEETIEEAVKKSFDIAYDKLNGKANSVCANITLQFNQTMTMTRQAFRGTLKVHNGNTEEPMKDILLQLEIRKASDGSLATSHEMQINAEALSGFEGSLNLTDGWTLAPNGDGTATILFIPSKYAAPTEAQDYTFGGRLQYLDPFTRLVVTRELSPVTLTVKPSPELDLTYFMQRDIYGDDPLTKDVIEPSEDAEFALLIHNKGYGEAINVVMKTQQPKIVDNQKGLYINFELISSQLNGNDKNLAFGESVISDFGNIASGKTMYAQWWLRSSLLGHFTNYNVEATHITSYGNKDLSLLDDVSIHELIRSLDVDKDEKIIGFLTNDIADSYDIPDMIYLSNGERENVTMASNVHIVKTSTTTCELTVIPSSEGWNYGKVKDPTYGMSKLISIIRNSDGKEISLRNFWQTDRTMRDGQDPLYENIIHFADRYDDSSVQTYTLKFQSSPAVVLNVETFKGQPVEGDVSPVPLTELRVSFNKPIKAETFTSDDMSFIYQGSHLDVSGVTITQVDDMEFSINLSELTSGDGFYVLTVNTANIMDIDGFYGEDGKSVSWMQYSDYGNLTAMSLCGQVTSMHDGLPVEGAFITLRHEDQTFTTRTDAIGNYVLTVPDVSHSYEVTCSSEDYCDVIEDDVIIPIQGLRRDFCLKRGVTIVIPSGGICTYSSSLNLDFTQARGGDIKAYYGKRYSNSTFIIEETHTAAAGEGLILKGTPLKQIDVPEAEEVVANDGNLFVGTAFAPYTVTTDDVYVLANKTGKPKFHPAAQGLVIPKNKAYLILYIGEAGAKGIDIIFDETTLIEMIQQAEDGEKHYGINGIRISDTVKGLHVLKGKKVIVK